MQAYKHPLFSAEGQVAVPLEYSKVKRRSHSKHLAQYNDHMANHFL